MVVWHLLRQQVVMLNLTPTLTLTLIFTLHKTIYSMTTLILTVCRQRCHWSKCEICFVFVYMNSITNLKYWGGSEPIISKTLQLLNELSVGYSSVRKLVKLEAVQFMLANHTVSLGQRGESSTILLESFEHSARVSLNNSICGMIHAEVFFCWFRHRSIWTSGAYGIILLLEKKTMVKSENSGKRDFTIDFTIRKQLRLK